jgi:hypothetical protein
MDRDTILGRIEHESAELRARHPHVRECLPALMHWQEAGQARYSLALDIRWPQHQTLLSGPVQPSAEAAVDAAFKAAGEQLRSTPPPPEKGGRKP